MYNKCRCFNIILCIHILSHLGSRYRLCSWIMALTAKDLHEQYGPELSRPPLADCGSAYYLHKALRAKGIDVSHQACKLWWCKYRVVPGKVSISTATELEEQHGSAIRHLGIEYNTAFKLCRALQQFDPPLYVTDQVSWVSARGKQKGIKFPEIH